MASSVGNGCGRLLVVCCVRVSMGWGTSFGSDLWYALNLCLSCCYVTSRVTPFAQTHPSETLGASKLTGSMVPRAFEFALPFEPYPYDPAKAKQLLAEAGYPNGFDAGDLTPTPPYFDMGESISNYLRAVGIKTKLRPMERLEDVRLKPE